MILATTNINAVYYFYPNIETSLSQLYLESCEIQNTTNIIVAIS